MRCTLSMRLLIATSALAALVTLGPAPVEAIGGAPVSGGGGSATLPVEASDDGTPGADPGHGHRHGHGGGADDGPPALCEVQQAQEDVLPVLVDCPADPAAPGAPRPAPPADVAAVAAQDARDVLTVLIPEPGTSPPRGTPAVTGLPIFLYVDPARWHPGEAQASIGDIFSRVTATPVQMVWDMGNHTERTCAGPANPYSRSTPDPACGYTYASKGRYTVTVTVIYQVTWESNVAGVGGRQADLALQTRFRLDVIDEQAVTN